MVVRSDTVDVVDDFTRLKAAADFLLHHQPVLADIALLVREVMTRHPKHHVAVWLQVPTSLPHT